MPVDMGELQARLTLDKGDFDKEISSVKTSLGSLSKVAAAAGAAVAGAATVIGTQAVRASARFEQAITEAGIKVQATNDTLERLETAAINAGKATKFTATESANALTFLGQAGFTAAQQVEALPSVLELAAAENMNVARTADIASNIMKGFGKEASEVNEISDLLVKTSQTANTNVQELGQAMSFAAPAARSAGVSMAETAAAVGTLSDAGIKAGRAGRGVRTVLAKMSEASKELGGDLSQSDIAAQGFAGSLQQLQKEGLNSGNALELFGRRHGVVVQAILQEGIPAFRDLTKEVKDNANAAGKAADKQLDTLSGKYEQLTGSVDVALTKLGDELNPAMKDVTDTLRKHADQVSNAEDSWAALGEEIVEISAETFFGAGLEITEAMGLNKEGTAKMFRQLNRRRQSIEAVTSRLKKQGALSRDAEPTMQNVRTGLRRQARAELGAESETQRRKVLQAQAPGLAAAAPGLGAAPGEGRRTQMRGTVFEKTTKKQIQSLDNVNESLDKLDKSVKKDVKAAKKQREALIKEINQGKNTRRAVEARKRLMRKGRSAAQAVLGGATGPRVTAQAKALKAQDQFRQVQSAIQGSPFFRVMKDAGKTLLVAGKKLNKAGDKQNNTFKDTEDTFRGTLSKARGAFGLASGLANAIGKASGAGGATRGVTSTISQGLSGAATGFSLGGPLGAAAGAGVGLLTGIISQTADQKQKAQKRRENRKQIKQFANRTAERLADEMEERQLQARVIRIDASGALVGSEREVSSRMADLLENEVGRREGFNI